MMDYYFRYKVYYINKYSYLNIHYNFSGNVSCYKDLCFMKTGLHKHGTPL